MPDTSQKLTLLQRAGFVLVLLGLFMYLSYEIFEDVLGISASWDEFMGIGLTALTYVLLFPLLKMKKWQAKAVIGLMVFMNLVDLIAPDGSFLDELVTMGVIAAVFYLIFNGIVRIRFELVRD